MTFAPHDILDRLAFLTARPVRARPIDFDMTDGAIRGRFVDDDDRWVAVVWADLDAVLCFSAAAAMLPLEAAVHSLAHDPYLFDDFATLIDGCASAFDPGGIRLAELSETVTPPEAIGESFAMQVWVPGYGSGRIGFASVVGGSAGFRRSATAVTARRTDAALPRS